MRTLRAILLPLTILLCLACASSKTVALGGDAGKPMELTIDTSTRTVNVDSGDDVRHTIHLEEILDSRCPPNAKCIWAGELAASLEIARVDRKSGARTERQITLAQITTPTVSILGASFELVRIDKSSVTFRFTRAE